MLVLESSMLQQQVQAISERIKAAPLEASHRVALANLRLLQGDHRKALQQLQVACQMDAQWQPQAQLVRALVRAERQRVAVFEGKIKPDLVAAPPAWLHALIDALAAPPFEAATLRADALEQAPENPGSTDGTQLFDWLADGDGRLGPVFEVMLAGNYYWVPMSDVQSIAFQPIGQPIDLLWRACTLRLHNAPVAERICHMPMRYPAHLKATLAPGNETEWIEVPDTEEWIGLGQRIWYAADHPFSMSEVGTIEFQHKALPSPSSTTDQPA